MDANCIGCRNHVVFRLPWPVAVPQEWAIHEVKSVSGDRYRLAGPPSDSSQSCYYWPWVCVRRTREEAERDALPWKGKGDYVYGVVVAFPLGGYVWYQTGLQPRSRAEERAQQAMVRLGAELGLALLLPAAE